MRGRILALALSLSLLGVPSTAGALPAAQDAGNGSFTVDLHVEIEADRDEVYRQILQVGEWWHPDHTFFGDAARMTLEPRPGGCFCESWPDGRWVEHLRVVNVNPGIWIAWSEPSGRCRSTRWRGR